LECCEARWLPRTAIREQCSELIAYLASAYAGQRDEVCLRRERWPQSLGFVKRRRPQNLKGLRFVKVAKGDER